ncbi:MAG: LacI family DNA-binding transcriptional regulator, partial [Delftia acidovorans]|nr:LacI family DNA-binding transcriptional regulator [Delftia acidovorans]
MTQHFFGVILCGTPQPTGTIALSISINDVARAAGVSKSTVSRALAGG